MHHDDKTLADITNKTMLRLINEEIVVPAKYEEVFSEEQRAAEQRGEIDTRGADIALLREQLFSDDVTAANNRLWVYKQKLNDRQGFSDDGWLVSLRIADYATIVNEYDANVGNRVLKMVSDYIVAFMKEHQVAYEFARFYKGEFLIFLHGMDEAEVEQQLLGMQKGMESCTFKYRSRIFGLSCDMAASRYLKNESFASVLDQLEEKRFEKAYESGGTTGRT